MEKVKKFLGKYDKSTHILALTIFVATFAISCFFIWMSDDFSTTYTLMDSIKISLFLGNGRYIGNFIVNIMAIPILDRLIRSLLITIFIVVMSGFTVGYNKKGLLLCTALLYGVSYNMFIEVILWGHGFYNYFPPVVLMLLALVLIKNNKSNTASKIWICIIGICQQLFVENLTTISIIASIFIIVYMWLKKKDIKLSLMYIVSLLVGALIMFTVPVLMHTNTGMDAYRTINGGFEGYLNNTLKNLWLIADNFSIQFVLWALISVAFIMNAVHKNLHKNKLYYLAYFYFGFYPILALVGSIFPNSIFTFWVDIAFAIYLALSLFMIIVLYDKERAIGYIAVSALAIASILQLLVVTPIATRCLFLPYIIFSLIMLYMYKEVFDKATVKSKKVICGACAFVSVIMYSIFMLVSVNSWYLDNVRADYIKEQVSQGVNEFEVVKFPFGGAVFVVDDDGKYVSTYFYGLISEKRFSDN